MVEFLPPEVGDYRFEGMELPQLAQWIDELKQGPGAAEATRAATAVNDAAKVIADLDEQLRVELGKIGVAWHGNAGQLAQQQVQQQSMTMAASAPAMQDTSSTVGMQGEEYSATKHKLPEPGELRHKQSENVVEWGGGAFGYESDYDAEAKQIDANKKAAAQALGSYQQGTVSRADAFQPLPHMQPATVSAQSATPGMSSVGSGVGGSGFSGGDAGTGHFSGGGAGIAALGGGSRAGGGSRDQLPGGGHSGGDGERPGEGGSSGQPDLNPHDDPGAGGIGLGGVLGIGAGGAAVAGIGAVAAGRLLGGGAGGAARGGAEGSARGGGSAAEGKGSPGRGGASGVGGGPGDTTAGRTASGSATSKPAAGSLMGPAAARGRPAEGDEDHENKYAVDDETPFDDNRLAAPSVFGADRSADDADEQSPAEERPEQVEEAVAEDEKQQA